MSLPNEAFYIATQAGCVPVCVGMPGEAKSASMEAFGAAIGRRVYTLISSIRDPADIAGFPQLRAYGDDLSCVELVPPKYVMDIMAGDKWVLFIDEVTTCPPAVQAALLRVVAERVVGDTRLPDDLLICMAANPTEIAANGFDFEPPMANRLVHLEWQMDWTNWSQGMLNGGTFPAPRFPVLPEGWESHKAAVGAEIAGYHAARPDAFSVSESDAKNGRSKMLGAYPSPRTWHYALNCLAACRALRTEETVQYELVQGCVGRGVADEFMVWRRNLDLPDPQEVLSDAIRAARAGKAMTMTLPNRMDILMALSGSVVSRAIGEINPDTWLGALTFLEHVADAEYTDIALACGQPLLNAKLPEDRDDKDYWLPKKYEDLVTSSHIRLGQLV